MTAGRVSPLLGSIEALFGAGSLTGWSDGELLARFSAGRDPLAEAAFAALVHRHGPMVLKVCRELLGDHHAVEDAFQATFLVLARKARTVRRPESLGRWLHGVAVRAARKARSFHGREARYGARQDASVLDEAIADDPPSDLELIRREAAELLHEELGRLPEKYRAPVILCHLEGLTHEEAARRLGWPSGTVSVRLMRARELLRHRLTRRGVAPAVAAGAALAAEPATAAVVPARLIEATTRAVMQAAIGPAGTAAAVLAKGVLRARGLARLRSGAALLAAVVLGVTTGVAAAHRISRGPEDDLEARALELARRFEPLVAARRPPSPAPMPAAGPNRAPSPADFVLSPPDPGYERAVSPNVSHPPLPGLAWGDLAEPEDLIAHGYSDVRGRAYFHQAQGGDMVITIGRALAPERERLLECCPILFDARLRQHLPEWERSTRSTGESGDRVTIDRFRIGPDRLPFEAIAAVGIGRMTTLAFEAAARAPGPGPARITLPAPDPFSGDGHEAGPGCSWALAPRPVGRGDWTAAVAGPGGGVACDVSTTRDGVLAIHLAYRSSTRVFSLGGPVVEYRPVLFDADGRRRVLAPLPTGGGPCSKLPGGLPIKWSDTAMFRYEVAPDIWRDRSGPERAALIGVERLSPQALRAARIESFLAAVRDREGQMDRRDRERRSQPKALGGFEVLKGPIDAVYLGAYDVLRGHGGERAISPGTLRAARIADFARYMAILERCSGPPSARWVETPLLDAYEIFRRQSAGTADGRLKIP